MILYVVRRRRYSAITLTITNTAKTAAITQRTLTLPDATAVISPARTPARIAASRPLRCKPSIERQDGWPSKNTCSLFSVSTVAERSGPSAAASTLDRLQ